MISDILYDADCAIRRYQLESSGMYESSADRINELRCQMNVLRMELETDPHLLKDHPIYEACKRGDISLFDRHMDGDDTVLAEWHKKIESMRRAALEDTGHLKQSNLRRRITIRLPPPLCIRNFDATISSSEEGMTSKEH
jgi:hypothetical protein